jgi:NRDE-2, necessary for RNA interference
MQEAKQVPKFASFKAKPTPPTEDVKVRRVDEEAQRRDERSRHKSRHHSHSRRHRSHSRSRHSKHSYRRDVESPRDAPPAPSQPEEETQDIYRIDRKGDIHNVIYGTIHRYSIPQYRRVGRGSVLGLPARFKIDRNHEGEGSVLVCADRWIADGARHKTKSILSRADTKERSVLRIRQDLILDNDDAHKNFIPLNYNDSRKKRRISGGDVPGDDMSDDEAERYGYRSILGKAKPEQDIPSDMEVSLESDSDEEGNAVKWNREANHRNSELLRRAEDNPLDIGAWIELIKYQDTLLAGSDSRRQLTVAEKRSLADIKLSLYDKALKKVGKHPEKHRLLLGYLEEGANLWDSKRLGEQWHTILKHNSGHISLWMRYIDFRQTAFLDFAFERCKSIYLDCIKLNASSEDNAEKEAIHMYLFLRMTLFIREAGFSELAVGLWQAALELSLFRPQELAGSSKDDVMSAFALFWESEVARIGEPGAKGWNSGKSPELEAFTVDVQTQIQTETLFSSWNAEERRLSRGARLPARTMDIVENDDPYRVILWSDIETFLPFFTTWRDKNILIESFLKFCYLPPLNSLQRSTRDAASSVDDAFLRTELVYLSDSSITRLINPSSSTSEQVISPPVFDMAPLQNMIHSVDSLFADSNWFQSLAMWKEIMKNEEAIIDAEWVRRSLRLLVGAFSQDDILAECALAVEYAINPSEGKKYAKSLLKKRPSSLRLYNAFALMETRNEKFSTASHVWATTLSMAATLSEAQRLEYGTIVRSWAWECLVSRREDEAIKILVSVPDFAIDLKTLEQESSSISPAQQLKTERFLREHSDHALSRHNLTSFAAWMDVTALLHYLTTSLNLSPALEVYNTAFDRLAASSIAEENKTSALELLHQYRSRLLFHHINTKRTYRPADVREIMLASTTLFPHNTMFLSLFTWNEARFRIDERIRGVFLTPAAGINQTPVTTTSLLNILTELARPVYSGSTIHSSRAAFERALPSPSSFLSSSSSSSPSLWKLYIYFELHRAKDPTAAQRVFHRAIRACPWLKDIFMLAFNEAQDLWDKNKTKNDLDDWWEQRKIYNVLVDKELRIHVEIGDEVFDEVERVLLDKERNRRDVGQQRKQDRKRRKGREVIYLPDDGETD